LASIFLLAAALAAPPRTALALNNDCSQPLSVGNSPVASDCLFILKAATGSTTCATPCVCNTNGLGGITATDSLLCLIEAVGDAPLACNCPDLQDPAYSFVPTDCPIASQQAEMVATDYVGAFSQDTAGANWTAGWTIEVNGNPPNKTVWHPATAGAGTLNGAVPSANGACPAGTTDVGNTNMPAPFAGSMDICQMASDYLVNGTTVTLTNDNVYTLGGAATQGTKFGDGDAADKLCPGVAPPVGYTNAVTTNLVIEPGTLIMGLSSEALAITRGSNIDVNGTAANPVVMTSKTQWDNWVAGGNGDSGRSEWGGFVLSGCGQANQCNDPVSCDIILEGFLTPFNSGGQVNADDSGDIEYLVVQQAGFPIAAANELNGITLYNVGSATLISHVQVHDNSDDGIEWFGGAVVVDHAVLTSNSDDDIDTDLGTFGGLQFALVNKAFDEGDRVYEADSHPNPGIDPQITEPCVVNVTSLGSAGGTTTEGLNVGTGTRYTWYNGVHKGHDEECIALENGTLALRGAGLQIHNHYISDCAGGEFTGAAPDTAATVAAWYDADPNNRRSSIDGSVVLNAIGMPPQNNF
jgi:hypothetical protein